MKKLSPTKTKTGTTKVWKNWLVELTLGGTSDSWVLDVWMMNENMVSISRFHTTTLGGERAVSIEPQNDARNT